MPEIPWKRIGDELYIRLDEGLVLAVRDLRRDRGEGGYRANFLATEEATGLVAWGDVRLSGATSRESYLKNLRAVGMTPPSAARLSDVCLLIDRLERQGKPPTVMVPRKPSQNSWLVPGWMPLHRTSILYGPGGTGKSLLALYFAVCALNSRPCGRWPIAPVNRVLYLDWEEPDAETHEERLYGILGPGGFPDPGDRLLHWPMVGPLSDSIERVRIEVDRQGADLVIVDSLHAASGGEVEGAEAALRTLSALQTLSKASRVTLGHVNAMGAEQTEGIPKLYGSIFNTNLARATIYLAEDPVSEQEKILTAHLKKHNRGGAKRPLGFKLVFSDDPDSTDVWIEAHEPDLSRGPLGERILAFLKESRIGAESAVDMAEVLGVQANQIRAKLHDLKKRSLVVQLSAAERGRGKKPLWGLVDRKRSGEEA